MGHPRVVLHVTPQSSLERETRQWSRCDGQCFQDARGGENWCVVSSFGDRVGGLVVRLDCARRITVLALHCWGSAGVVGSVRACRAAAPYRPVTACLQGRHDTPGAASSVAALGRRATQRRSFLQSFQRGQLAAAVARAAPAPVRPPAGRGAGVRRPPPRGSWDRRRAFRLHSV